MTKSPLISVHRVVTVDSVMISQINRLLDSGTVWDELQGKKFLANPDNALFLGLIDDQPVGFLTAHRLQRFDRRQAEVLLYEVGVLEPFRRKGVAKALIAELKTWTKKINADEIWVLTEQSNLPAVALYQSAGAQAPQAGDDLMMVMKLKRSCNCISKKLILR